MAKLISFKKVITVMVALALPQVLYAGSDIFVDFEATVGADDNVTRAAEDVDVEYDVFLTLAGTGGYKLYQGKSSALVGKVLLEGNKFSEFNGLSNIVASGKLNYTFGFSKSFGAPWFAVDAEYGVIEFNSFMRDSNVFRTTATMGMQIDDATSMRLGLSYKDRDAESTAFDNKNASVFINLDWAVLKKHIVYVTYKYDQGDTFSSASDPSVEVLDAATFIVLEDDVFDGKRTYRLDAVTQFVTVGYNIIQDLHSSFDLSARYLKSEADDVDLTYEDLAIRLSYFHRFNL